MHTCMNIYNHPIGDKHVICVCVCVYIISVCCLQCTHTHTLTPMQEFIFVRNENEGSVMKKVQSYKLDDYPRTLSQVIINLLVFIMFLFNLYTY